MSQAILDMISSVSAEKQLSQEIVFDALEAALAVATARKIGPEVDVRVDIDRSTGDYSSFRRWTVVRQISEEELALLEEDESYIPEPYYLSSERHYTLEEALNEDPEAELGKQYLKSIENIEFGRIATQSARQVMFAKLKEAQSHRVAADYRNRLGQLVNGTVKKVMRNREKVLVELDAFAEAVLPRKYQLDQDEFQPNTVIYAVLEEIGEGMRGPQLILSRTSPAMVERLLEREVPEVAEQIVEIKGVAREPGGCSKVAVASGDARIDAVGACVGISGVRVKQVMQELQNERIDIFAWDDDLIKLASNAMAPAAQPIRVTADEQTQALNFVVPREQLARAIGRNGLNVRLASKLTGWAINVLSEEDEAEQKREQKQAEQSNLVDLLDVSEQVANALLAANIRTAEDLMMLEPEDLAELEGLDLDKANQMLDLASDILLREAVLEGSEDTSSVDKALIDLPDMDPDLAYQLSQAGFSTPRELGESGLDDVLEKLPDVDEDLVSQLILSARADIVAAANAEQATKESQAAPRDATANSGGAPELSENN
ncbi:MAG: transcription termination factor NusA [Gammaproteobacteria bacterium]